MMVLDGIKVIDLSQFISGSRCTQILADMGAEVVKIEPPEGDTLRLIFSLIPGAERNYSVFNRNKYGISLDWRHPGGLEIMHRLAAKADIFVHNLIPGTLERNHLGYADLKKIRKDIIYLALSGFGSSGTNPQRAAFDIVAQATSGQFWNDLENLRPPSNYWADLISGAYAALAGLLALIHRMKTGEGQFVDISMQDVLYFNNYRAMIDRSMEPIMDQAQRTLGRRPDEVLNSADRMPFYGFFKSRHGKVAIVALTQRQWEDLANITGHPELATDPRFNNIVSQIHNHEDTVRRIEEWTSKNTSEEIIAVLEAKKIPCGMAYSSKQVNKDENLKTRGMFSSVFHEKFGEIDVPGIPFHFSQTPGNVRSAAPMPGEHNRLVLEQWLGLTEDEINDLYKDRIIV
jgi:crotonobetainyl-CoA:carnitine CoA-transferase CaiB-like acyl-CoA transferase